MPCKGGFLGCIYFCFEQMGKVDSYWYRGVGEYYCSCQWMFILTLGKYFPGVLCQAGVHCWGARAGFSVRSINIPALLVSVTSTDIYVGSPRGFNNQAFRCLNPYLWPWESLGALSLTCFGPRIVVWPPIYFWNCLAVSIRAAELGLPDWTPSL